MTTELWIVLAGLLPAVAVVLAGAVMARMWGKP